MSAATQSGIYSVLDDENINARGDFFRGLGAGIDGSWATSLGSVISSDTEIEDYKWIGTSPQMAIWEGEALLQEMPNYAATLRNDDYLSGLKINKGDIRRDKTGQIRQRIADLGTRVSTHWETLTSTLIANGETASGTDLSGKAFDDQAFFDTDHTYLGSNFTTNQSNDLSGGVFDVTTATAPTVEESVDAILGMVGNFYTLKDDQGEPINANANSFTLMVGTSALWGPMQAAVSQSNLAGGETNPIAGMDITVILNPRLSAKTTKVYMFANVGGGGVGSFILQDEVAVNVGEEDPGRTSKHIEVTAQAVRAAGYAQWQKACVATLS